MSFVLWCLITEKKWYPIIVMDAFEQACEMLEAIKAELEANPRLQGDFEEACGQGKVWRAGVIVTASGRKVEAFGSAKKIRGRRHGPYDHVPRHRLHRSTGPHRLRGLHPHRSLTVPEINPTSEPTRMELMC